MAMTVGLAEAVAPLDDQVGTELDANHEEGPRLMADVLSAHFGIAHRAARTLVDALEQAHTISYVADRAPPESAPGAAYGGHVGLGLGGFGPAAEYAGHWQIVWPA